MSLNHAALVTLISALAQPTVELLYVDRSTEVDFMLEHGMLQHEPAAVNPANPAQLAVRLVDRTITADDVIRAATPAGDVSAETAAWAVPAAPTVPTFDGGIPAPVQVAAVHSGGLDYDVPYVAPKLATSKPKYDFDGLREAATNGHSNVSLHIAAEPKAVASAVSNATRKLKKLNIDGKRFSAVKVDENDPKGAGTRVYYVNTDGTPLSLA